MQIYYINNNWYKFLYQKFSTKISTYGRDGVGVGALMLWPCVRYHQRMRQRAILKYNTKLVHKNWNCKFLSRKTQKRKYTPVGGISHPWGWIMLLKHFMRLNGVFRKNMTIAEGLRWSAWMGAAPQRQGVGHNLVACVRILTQNTRGRGVIFCNFSYFALASIENWNTFAMSVCECCTLSHPRHPAQ